MSEKRKVKLIETTIERFNLKRGWFVKAYRIVDLDGTDAIQPYPTTKKEARQICKDLNLQLIEN